MRDREVGRWRKYKRQTGTEREGGGGRGTDRHTAGQ